MASHRRARPLGRHSAVTTLSRSAATVLAATAAVLAGGGSALADPAAPATADQVRQQVQSLYARAEVAGQQYDGAKEQEQALLRSSGLLQQRVAVEQQHINTMEAGMGELASAQYRQGGGMDPLVRLLFSAHPDQYLAQASSADQVDASTAQTLHQVEAEQRQLAQDRTEAVGELARLESLRRSIAGSKAQVQQQLGHARALLAGLDGAQRSALAQAEQQVEDVSAQAAAAAESVLPVGEGPASASAAVALAAARSALGRPYVYGATGPGSFDCSGLMYWSWQHAGVRLPRTSQEQMYAGRLVPLSQARPGDLVIYYSDHHHVGMYAGNGMVIHAPYPGARVRYEPVDSMPVAGVVRV
ncbi:C40 family peptidase [Streptacidiphilus cavernicola]|uniref:NlpC/P60 family protein n=1 Tax=Streptacidiphilus cavernicola TaxID=3342716 RepID=A0ABV6VST4_9ACTN